MALDDQMKGKRESLRRLFRTYTVFPLVLFLVLISLWIATNYYRHQVHQKEYVTMFLDESGLTIQASRSMLEMQVIETRTLIDNELESIENREQGLMTGHVIDRSEWAAKKDKLNMLLDFLDLERTDQLYIDIEYALADIDKILSS